MESLEETIPLDEARRTVLEAEKAVIEDMLQKQRALNKQGMSKLERHVVSQHEYQVIYTALLDTECVLERRRNAINSLLANINPELPF